jgi:rhamnosyltransferase subunit B
MRVLLFPFGSLGDVRPFVVLGKALKARGHEVVLAANERFAGMARPAGLELQSQGTEVEYKAVLESPALWHPTRGPRLLHDYTFGPTVTRHVETVRRGAGPDTVVVAGTLAVGAWLGAQKHGLPCVRLHGQPAPLFGPHDPPVLPTGKKMGGPLWWRRALLALFDRTLFKPVGRDLNRYRRELGLTEWRSHFMSGYTAADLTLCMFPSWFAEATPDWPDNAHHVGFVTDPEDVEGTLSPTLAAFIDRGPPPVVFTPGPAGYQHGDAFFTAAGDACRRAGLRAVFVTRGQELGGSWPDSVFICAYAPFGPLFGRAAAVVHHGGIGTVASALAAGKRQLITPFGADQPDNAWRVKRLAIGDSLAAKALRGPALAAKLGELLSSTVMGDKAALLARQLAQARPAIDVACELIEGQASLAAGRSA